MHILVAKLLMNSAKYISGLRSIFLAMLLGLMVIACISYLFLKPANGIAPGQSLYVMLGFSVGIFMLLLYALLNKQKNQDASQQKTLSDKLIAFQNNYMILASMLLGPGLMNFVLYGIGGPIINFYIGLFFLTILATRYPSVQLISRLLQLPPKEVSQLNDDQYKIY